MKVSDFQKCLCALADAISTKTPAKELVEAADALTPFASYTMGKFAEFLQRVEAKYDRRASYRTASRRSPFPLRG